jgi:hypothetical protein
VWLQGRPGRSELVRARRGFASFTAGQFGPAIGVQAIATRAARSAIGPRKYRRRARGCANAMGVRSCGPAGGLDTAPRVARFALRCRRPKSDSVPDTTGRSHQARGGMDATRRAAAVVTTVVRAIFRPRHGTTSVRGGPQVKLGRKDAATSVAARNSLFSEHINHTLALVGGDSRYEGQAQGLHRSLLLTLWNCKGRPGQKEWRIGNSAIQFRNCPPNDDERQECRNLHIGRTDAWCGVRSTWSEKRKAPA